MTVSLGYPHPDFLFEKLTADQAYELCLYHGIEPFGEVRQDLRTAHLLQSYLRMNSKKGSKIPSLGALTLYPDMAESAAERQGTDELASHLQKLGAKRG